MKVQCVQCKEVVPLGRFRIDGEVIEVTCPECAATYRVNAQTGDPSPSPAPAEPRVSATGEECPKCGRELATGAEACAACGLRHDRFAEFAAAVPDEPPAIATAWAVCRERWDEAAAHDVFLDAVAGARAFGAAARRYREVLRDQPGDERARRGLDRVTRMAEVALLGSPSRPRGLPGPEPYKNLVLLLLVLVALGGVFGIYALFRAKQAREEPPDTPSLHDRRTPIRHPAPDRKR